ncbi:MAG: FxsA family protein [SAR324 cluster bacterium]|nr:FxsA family protein [SAR324 cluster bacterium]
MILLVFSLELFIIFGSSVVVIYSLLGVHSIFLGIGIYFLKKQDLQDLFLADSIILKKEPITQELADEAMLIIAYILMVVPSVICHLAGLGLTITRARRWITGIIFDKII